MLYPYVHYSDNLKNKGATEDKFWIKSTSYEEITTRLMVPKFQTYGHAIHLLMI